MKTFRNLLTAAVIIPLLTACLSDETSNSGFSGVAASKPYANGTVGYLTFASWGDWQMTQNTGSDWCTVDCMQGNGNSIYTIPVKFTQNTTGIERSASFRLVDKKESEAYANFVLSQYATRGDGTLGNAALVKQVTGDDGTAISVTYDELARPKTLNIEKNGTTLRDFSISYSETDSTISVGSTAMVLTGVYDDAYQPGTLTSETDTVGYTNMYTLGSYLSFNVEERRAGGEYKALALLLTGQNLSPDREHVADSLKYQHRDIDGNTYTEKLKLSYSDNDNRCQSLDVNQLLLGIEECNPYVLLSLYKHARDSKIISEATASDGKFTVETTLNSNGSVNTMTVTDKQGGKITYTFSY